jgi:hypothetical protein
MGHCHAVILKNKRTGRGLCTGCASINDARIIWMFSIKSNIAIVTIRNFI